MDKSRATKKLEGEGSYSAARRYDANVRSFQSKADVPALARDAKRAVEGPQGAELRRAEIRGKAKPKGARRSGGAGK